MINAPMFLRSILFAILCGFSSQLVAAAEENYLDDAPFKEALTYIQTVIYGDVPLVGRRCGPPLESEASKWRFFNTTSV